MKESIKNQNGVNSIMCVNDSRDLTVSDNVCGVMSLMTGMMLMAVLVYLILGEKTRNRNERN